MRKKSIYIYTRKNIFLLIVFTIIIVSSFFHLFLEEERLNNFLAFLLSIGIMLTVGWLVFAFMGKIQLRDGYLLVFRNFKNYRFILSSVTFYFGHRKPEARGGYEYPLFIVGDVESEDSSTKPVTLKLIGSKRKNRQFQQYYDQYLQGKARPIPEESSWRINYLRQLEILSDKVCGGV